VSWERQRSSSTYAWNDYGLREFVGPHMSDNAYLSVRRLETVQAAIRKFTKKIDGRDGLSDLSNIFDEIDTDGNGTLDPEEFRAGLDKYGMDMSDTEVSDLYRLLDANGDGVLTLEEFSSITKNELEMADLEKMWSDNSGNVSSEAQELAIKAATSGTRFTRTNSVAYDLKRQGMFELTTTSRCMCNLNFSSYATES
jgi:hypothetical protein